MSGVWPQSSLEFGQGLLRLMQFEQYGTQEVVCVSVVRFKCRYPLKAFQGPLSRFNAVQDAQGIPDVRIFWVLGRGLFERLFRFRHFLQIDQRDVAVKLRMDQRRVKLVGVCEFGLPVIQQLLIHQRGAKIV